MSPEFANSNLSKIKPKLRTQGRVSGNFGRNKTSVGSSLKEIGVTSAKVVKCNTQEDYLNRLHDALTKTEDPKLKTFISNEIKKILIQRGQYGKMTR